MSTGPYAKSRYMSTVDSLQLERSVEVGGNHTDLGTSVNVEAGITRVGDRGLPQRTLEREKRSWSNLDLCDVILRQANCASTRMADCGNFHG